MENLLSRFLNAGLLPHLNTDERFKFVEATIEEISKKLAKNRINLVRFTLTALHPDISDKLPAIREIDVVLAKFWKTIRVNIPDAPRQIWRAIIWEALNKQSKDITSAAIIWLTSSSVINHLTIDPNEREVITEFLISLRDKVEKKAVGEWGKPEQITNNGKTFNYEPDKMTVYTAITDKLEKDLLKACGPTDTAGTAIAGANPHWTENQATWAAQFAKLASKAIGDRIDKSAVNVNDSVKDELNKLSEELKQSISSINENIFHGITAERLRDDLLWWRQTLYSQTFKNSYRSMSFAEAVIFMAFDLSKILPTIYPVSVEYLLREAFGAAHNKHTQEKAKLSDVIKLIVESSNTGIIEEETVNYYKNFDEPLPLFALIIRNIGQQDITNDLIKIIGLKEDTEISLEDLSVWFLRDLQAHSLVIQK